MTRQRSYLTGLTGPERLWARLTRHRRIEDECWIWTGTVRGRGANGQGDPYGGIQVTTHRAALVHRVAYELLIGPIPEGIQIDHLCEHTMCFNPAHLKLATARENTLRSGNLGAQNAQKTHCVRGHPFDEANTRVSRGSRVCRACDRARPSGWARQRQATA